MPHNFFGGAHFDTSRALQDIASELSTRHLGGVPFIRKNRQASRELPFATFLEADLFGYEISIVSDPETDWKNAFGMHSPGLPLYWPNANDYVDTNPKSSQRLLVLLVQQLPGVFPKIREATAGKNLVLINTILRMITSETIEELAATVSTMLFGGIRFHLHSTSPKKEFRLAADLLGHKISLREGALGEEYCFLVIQPSEELLGWHSQNGGGEIEYQDLGKLLGKILQTRGWIRTSTPTLEDMEEEARWLIKSPLDFEHSEEDED